MRNKTKVHDEQENEMADGYIKNTNNILQVNATTEILITKSNNKQSSESKLTEQNKSKIIEMIK